MVDSTLFAKVVKFPYCNDTPTREEFRTMRIRHDRCKPISKVGMTWPRDGLMCNVGIRGPTRTFLPRAYVHELTQFACHFFERPCIQVDPPWRESGFSRSARHLHKFLVGTSWPSSIVMVLIKTLGSVTLNGREQQVE